MKKLEQDRLTVQLMAGQETFPAQIVRSLLQDISALQADSDCAWDALRAARRRAISELGVTQLLNVLTTAAEQDGAQPTIEGPDSPGNPDGWALYAGGEPVWFARHEPGGLWTWDTR